MADITVQKINKKNGQIINQDDIAKIDNNATLMQNAINSNTSKIGGIADDLVITNTNVQNNYNTLNDNISNVDSKLVEHIFDSIRHITKDERTKWNYYDNTIQSILNLLDVILKDSLITDESGNSITDESGNILVM